MAVTDDAVQADDLAHRLAGLVAPDAVVGIMLPRDSHHLYAAQLAVLKAGAAFTCIDPVFPDAFVAAVLADGNISVLLTDQPHLARLRIAAELWDSAVSDALPVPASHKTLLRARRAAYERGELATLTIPELKRSIRRRS